MRSTRCLSLGAVVAVVALAAGSGVAAASPCAIGACTTGPMGGPPPTVVGSGSTFDGPVAPDPAPDPTPEPGATFDGGIPAIVPGPGHNPEFGPVPADGTNPVSIANPGFGRPPSDATNPVSIAPQPQDCGPAADQTVTATNAKAAEAALICLINNARLAAGLPPLTESQALDVIAAAHDADMSKNNFVAHNGTDGSTPQSRINGAGFTHDWAENVGCQGMTPREQFDAWLNEQPPNDSHRKNILNTNVTNIGVAVITTGLPAACGGDVLFTADFGH